MPIAINGPEVLRSQELTHRAVNIWNASKSRRKKKIVLWDQRASL